MVSRKTLYGAVVGCVMVAMVAILLSGLHLMGRQDAVPSPIPTSSALELRTEVATPSTDARVLGDTLLRQWGPRLDIPNSRPQP